MIYIWFIILCQLLHRWNNRTQEFPISNNFNKKNANKSEILNENYFHVYRFFNLDMNKSDSEYILCIIFKNVSLQFFESIHFPKMSNINRTKYLIILFKSKKKNWLEKNLFFRFKNIQICSESLKPIKSSLTLSLLGETLLQWGRKSHFFH